MLSGDAGRVSLRCMIRSIKNDAGRWDLRTRLAADNPSISSEELQAKMGEIWVDLPDVELTVGGTREPIEIRLPPEWDR